MRPDPGGVDMQSALLTVPVDSCGLQVTVSMRPDPTGMGMLSALLALPVAHVACKCLQK